MGEVLFFMALSCLTLFALLKLPLWGTDAPASEDEALPADAPHQAPQVCGGAVPERTEALASSLRAALSWIKEPSPAASLGRICSALEALAEHTQTQPQDVQATLRFLDRYGETTLKLASSYASLAQGAPASPSMRESTAQLKQMLRDLAGAYERFLLSLKDKEAAQLQRELEHLRILLDQDGLGGTSGTSVSSS